MSRLFEAEISTGNLVAEGLCDGVDSRAMVPGKWSSLADEVAVAAEVFGTRGDEVVASWLDVEAARASDRDFALLFSEHITLPGVLTADYLHRNIHTSDGDLLGGIRFYRRDVSRPFVEVIAHGFDSLDRLRDCVRGEWSMFRSMSLRLCARPGRISGPGVLPDQSIYVVRIADMRRSTASTSPPEKPPNVPGAVEFSTWYSSRSDRPKASTSGNVERFRKRRQVRS